MPPSGTRRPELRRAAVVLTAVALATAATGCRGDGDDGAPVEQGEPVAVTQPPAPQTAGPATAGADEKFPNPADMLPLPQDLPPGYVIDPDVTGPVGLDQALEDGVRSEREDELIRSERVAGWRVQFLNEDARAVGCQASTYRSAEAARELFELTDDRIGQGVTDQEATLMPVALEEEIGEEALAFVVQGPDGISAYFVGWRRRNVLASCFAAGLGGLLETEPELALETARRQQRRIEDALG